MFDQLVESRPGRHRSTAQVLVSIAVHTVVIVISIELTRAVAEPVPVPLTEIPMMLAHAPRSTTLAASTPVPNAVTAPPNLAPIASPIDIPVDIPPVSIERGFDPGRLNLTRGAGDASSITAQDNSLSDPERVVPMQETDEPSRYLDGPTPAYPPALSQAGVEGYVQIRYIVGVDGRAESGSVEVLKASNPLFEAPAITAILASHFAPARIRGRKVRQIVEQVVRFTLH